MKISSFVLVIGLLSSSTAVAQTTEEWDGGYGLHAERRSGFAVGADFGLALGNSDGYPKDAVKLNDPRYEADTKLGVGMLGRAWVGGTILDWFSFGLGLETVSASGNHLKSSGGAFFLRPEFYPLWTLGGPYRDLGIYADFGLGWLKTRKDSEVVADGGSLGVVGVGLFHETLRWHHLTVGPTIGCTTYFSETLKATVGQLGLRIGLTSGP